MRPFRASAPALTGLFLLLLLTPITEAAPRKARAPAEPATASAATSAPDRFDVAVKDMPARDFFLTLMEGTKQNLILSPDLTGNISLRLHNVTIEETLRALRETYGYEFQTTGFGYQISAANQNIRIYSFNYPSMKRGGSSETVVTGRGLTETQKQSGSGGGGSTTTVSRKNSTEIDTKGEMDVWAELDKALAAILGSQGKATVSPQAGTVIVNAPPELQRVVARFLQQSQSQLGRQVVIEAKIIEVELSDGFERGINWQLVTESAGHIVTGGVAGSALNGPEGVGGVFSSGVIAGDFTALLQLLQTQGKVRILSSPRVNATNNQKAVIKVGSDEFFVTEVKSNTTSGTGGTTTTPELTLTPFFSGIALDITPQIAADNKAILLHVHPSVSEVTTQNKVVDLGATLGRFNLPLAFSKVRESDTVVRAESGRIVALGGLIFETSKDETATTPFLGKLPILKYLFEQKRQKLVKSELVILLRPVLNEPEPLEAWLGSNGERYGLQGTDFFGIKPVAPSTEKR